MEIWIALLMNYSDVEWIRGCQPGKAWDHAAGSGEGQGEAQRNGACHRVAKGAFLYVINSSNHLTITPFFRATFSAAR